MRTIFLVLSALLSIGSTLPYMLDIIHKRTQPRIVTWINWTILTGIATAASIAAHQQASAVLTGAVTVATGFVVLLSLRHGTWGFSRLDIACQVAALIGFILWLCFDSPLVAIAASVLIDVLVAIPTYKHAWRKPKEETAATYVIATFAALCALAAVQSTHLTGLIYPVYLVFSDGLISGLLYFSPHK